MAEDDVDARWPGLTVIADDCVDLPVWHGPESDGMGNVDADELMSLGVSRVLVERLLAWHAGLSPLPGTSANPEFQPGKPVSVRLARQLQAELASHRIFLDAGSGPRPVDEWTD